MSQSTSNTIDLQIWQIGHIEAAGISREQAVKTAWSLLGKEGCGLAYTPSVCVIFRLAETLQQLETEPADCSLLDAYELRIFSSQGELRWLQNGGSGQAAFVTDNKAKVDVSSLEKWKKKPEIAIQDDNRIRQQYLLWGKEAESTAPNREGWTVLGAARIGRLYVPGSFSLQKDGRLALQYYEYIGDDPSEAGKHGNQTVLASRLLNFATTSPHKSNTPVAALAAKSQE